MVSQGTDTLYTIGDFTQNELPYYYYDKSAHFVAWLIETHGIDTFLELYARTRRGSSASAISAAFKDVLGEGAGAVFAAYDAAFATYYPGMGPQACGQGPVIPWEAEGAVWEFGGSCLDGPLLGEHNVLPTQRVAIEVPTSGVYVFDAGGRIATMRRCTSLPTRKADVQPISFPVRHDWEIDIEVIGDQEGEDWADLSLELSSGVYEIQMFPYPELDKDRSPEVSLREL